MVNARERDSSKQRNPPIYRSFISMDVAPGKRSWLQPAAAGRAACSTHSLRLSLYFHRLSLLKGRNSMSLKALSSLHLIPGLRSLSAFLFGDCTFQHMRISYCAERHVSHSQKSHGESTEHWGGAF